MGSIGKWTFGDTKSKMYFMIKPAEIPRNSKSQVWKKMIKKFHAGTKPLFWGQTSTTASSIKNLDIVLRR